jgi:uncharacterized membrane protein (Fun14 family)
MAVAGGVGFAIDWAVKKTAKSVLIVVGAFLGDLV